MLAVLKTFSVATAANTSGSVLPFPPNPMGGTVGYTMQNSTHHWRKQPPQLKDAPNIMIIMYDDAGFGQASAFGGGGVFAFIVIYC